MKDKIYKIFEIFGGILEFICPFLIGANLIERFKSITDFIIGMIIIVAFIIYRCEKLVKKEK